MNGTKLKAVRRSRRKRRVRKGVFGTAERPRLTVIRTLTNIGAQIIDDDKGITICQASTVNKDIKGDVKSGGNKSAAERVGEILAERASQIGVTQIVFDRNGYKYHGRIKALAESVRKAGLKF